MRSRSSLALLAALVAAAPAALSQGAQYRGAPPPFALTGCRIETVSSGTVERGTVVVGADGRIAAVGPDAAVPAGVPAVDCAGGTVYPGMIDGATGLGLQEIEAVPVTMDRNEVGEVTPQMDALTAFNPASALLPVTRVGGVTTALAMPDGGLMPGTAALVHLYGYNPAEMAVGFQGVPLQFPVSGRRGAFDRRPQADIDKAYETARERLDGVWRDAVLYAQMDSARAATRDARPLPFQPEFTALLPVVRGERPLLVSVDAAGDIVKAIEWVDGARKASHGRLRVVWMGLGEGWRVADTLAAAGWPAVVGPVIALPTRATDRYVRAYENAALLHAAGVRLALASFNAENARNLPFHAGFAAAYGAEHGFGRAEALRAVTLAPAEIFGVADRLGSIEVGKEATLFVATGDPFEPATQITHLAIGGWRVPIVSRQTELFDEYLDRAPAAGGFTGPLAPATGAPAAGAPMGGTRR